MQDQPMPKAYHAPARRKARAPLRAVPELRDLWAKAVIADPGMSGVIRVAWALREFVNRAGETTVGVARLCEVTGKGRRSVMRDLATLRAAGYLERFPGRGELAPGGRTALTRIALPESVDNSVDKGPSYPQPDAEVVAQRGQGSGLAGHPNPLTHKNAPSRAPSGAPGAQEERRPLQRELPMLADVRAASPEHVAATLKRLRAHVRNRRRGDAGSEER